MFTFSIRPWQKSARSMRHSLPHAITVSACFALPPSHLQSPIKPVWSLHLCLLITPYCAWNVPFSLMHSWTCPNKAHTNFPHLIKHRSDRTTRWEQYQLIYLYTLTPLLRNNRSQKGKQRGGARVRTKLLPCSVLFHLWCCELCVSLLSPRRLLPGAAK